MTAEQTLTVADGVVVSLDYVLTVDGEIVDSTAKSAPLDYLHGYGSIIEGLERALAGMAVGESKEVKVAPADAYGEFNPQAFAEIERSQFPAEFPLEKGNSLNVRDSYGQVMRAYIDEVSDSVVRLNLNHPLAGKELSFWAQVAAVRPATPDELAAGRLGGGCSTCGSSSGSCSGSCQ